MTYRETLEYLYSRLPVFTRIGKAAYKADLNNTLALCAALGNPEKNIRTIHIAGTNGKGSSSHFLASVLQQAGYKTGLFTSPHLSDFRERIRVNGRMIPARKVSRFVEKCRDLFESLNPSFFEMNVALAFDHFSSEQVDIAVIETGLGGRLDSTNVIVPELSLITNISFDHMDLLGDTLEKIAGEKAGIVKSGVPVIIAERQMEVSHVFIERAADCRSQILFAEDHVRLEDVQIKPAQLNLKARVSLPGSKEQVYTLCSPLTGSYQQKNLKGVLLALELLRGRGWKISRNQTEEGIRKVIQLTHLHGRWEQIGRHPDVICDTGHNEAGIREVMRLISRQTFRQLHIVWGMVADKEVEKILAMLPAEAHYFFCKAAIPRAMDAFRLQELAGAKGLKGKSYTSVRRALAAARRKAAPEDLIFVGGSTFVVAEVI
jgi:dihydrofolate synthase / folylpolyglutamate synthase